MAAALPMGGNKITGMADPTVSTDASTKNYVDTTTAAFFSTGDVKLTFKNAPDSGWLMFDDGTFGSASSGSSNSNSAANQALFTLFFNNMGDAAAPLLTSGGGATTRAAQTNAATAWAANCRMSLPKTLGRALGIAGTGSGLTSRPPGSSTGSEIATLVTGNLPPYTPSGSISQSLTVAFNGANISSAPGGGNSITTGGFSGTGPLNLNTATVGGSITFTGNAQGGTSAPFSIMQPSVFLNAMVKV